MELISMVVVLLLAPQGALPPDQGALVEAERAFAKLGVERGMRESFLTYFADSAIAFTPQPANAKEGLRKQPPETSPLNYRLNWNPTYGDISIAGDMGYNTGPARVDDLGPQKRPPQHMVFFSVWKKRPDGEWKVTLDVGVGVPSAVAALDAPFTPAREVERRASFRKVDVGKESAALMQFERDVLKNGSLREHLDETVRVNRSGAAPLVGKTAVQSWMASQPARSGEPQFADVSESGDLGYTYGSFEKGYYARVWRRNAGEAWKLVMEVLSALPAAGERE